MIDQKKIGVVMTYMSQGVLILSGIIYTPIMLRLLGQQEYGLYQLVASTVSYLSLLSLGFSSSYIRFYSRAVARDDEDSVSELNGMFMLIFLIISGLCLICGSFMVKNVAFIFSDGLSDAEYAKAKILMSILVFNLALTFPNSVFESFSTAHERFFFQQGLNLLNNILNPFLALPLLLMGYGAVGMVLVSTFLTILKLSVNFWYSVKQLKVKFCFRKFSFHLFKEMWVFTFFIFLGQIIDQINWSIDKLLLGRFSGTVAVAVYGVGAQINTMYLQLSTAVSNVFIPKVNKIVMTTDDNRELSQLFTKVGRIQFMILFLIVTGFIFWGQPFISYWAGNGYSESYYVVLLLIIPVTVPLIQNLGIAIQMAKNMHKVRSVVYFFIAVANIFISIPLIRYMGPVGAAMGTALSLIIGNILFMNYYYSHKIGLDIYGFWMSIISFWKAILIPLVVAILLRKFWCVGSFGVLVIQIMIYSIVYCISFYVFGMNKFEKDMIIGLAEKIGVVRRHG